VNNPSSYSLDRKYGPASGKKKCGGKRGNCCGKSNTCSNNASFCSAGNSLYGNYTVSPITTTPRPSADPSYYFGNTTDGLCGPTNDCKVCNVACEFCCASTGKCADGLQFCGIGYQSVYGNCTTSAVSPVPSPGDPSPGRC
jgi:hypothetical protein